MLLSITITSSNSLINIITRTNANVTRKIRRSRIRILTTRLILYINNLIVNLRNGTCRTLVKLLRATRYNNGIIHELRTRCRIITLTLCLNINDNLKDRINRNDTRCNNINLYGNYYNNLVRLNAQLRVSTICNKIQNDRLRKSNGRHRLNATYYTLLNRNGTRLTQQMITSRTRKIGLLMNKANNGSCLLTYRLITLNGMTLRMNSSVLKLLRTSLTRRVTNRLTLNELSSIITVTTRNVRINHNKKINGRIRIRYQDRRRKDLRKRMNNSRRIINGTINRLTCQQNNDEDRRRNVNPLPRNRVTIP